MKLLIFLTTLCLTTSCQTPTNYRPSILGHNTREEAIVVHATKERIYCNEQRFQEYVSVSIDDFQKLALLLKHSKVPKKVKLIVERLSSDVAELSFMEN